MEQSLWKGFLAGAACICLVGLVGCASPQPRDFTGAWRPLNRFAAISERVELRAPYVFRATPLDATLKGMLTRWAGDAGVRLDYRLSYDLTLHQPVERVRAERLADALAQLADVFAAQQVGITLAEDRIVVATRIGASVEDPPSSPQGVDGSDPGEATGTEAEHASAALGCVTAGAENRLHQRRRCDRRQGIAKHASVFPSHRSG